MADRKVESLHSSIGLLGISAGSLLLAVHFYSAPRASSLIPSTALGVLLLILSSLLAYAGIRRSLRNASLFLSLCLTISVFWCGYGVVFILGGQGVLNDSGDFRNALVPGLVTFTLALLIIAVVGFLCREVILALIASAVSLASAHEVAMHYSTAFGSSAVACNYMVVCLVGGYFGLGRILYFLTKEKIALPGTDLATKKTHKPIQPTGGSVNHFAVTGMILNMLSASVFGCRLLGVTGKLFIGQVPWLWAAGIYQIGICILSYRTMDALMATFFGFTSILKFAGGYCLLYPIWQPEEPSFPTPFLVVFSILFAVLALFLTFKSPVDGLYLLFYVAYCIALACRPKGFFEGGPQGVDVAIFVASTLMALIHLYNGSASTKIPTGKGAVKALLARSSFLKLREGADLHAPYLGYSKYADAEVLGYACSVLASFAMTMTGDPQAPLATVVIPWVVVAGGILKLLGGSVAFARGKTLESSAFILYAVMWIIWGLTRYGGLYGTTRSFHAAVGIIAFMLFNGFIVFCTLFLNIAWFFYALTFLLISVSFLLDAIHALPAGYDIAATIIFGLVSFYCFLSALFNSVFEGSCLPMGRPIVQLSGVGGGTTKCLHLPARKASSVKRIADILKNGGTCGIPTDTVYVLVAACNRPDAVEKAHQSKRQAQDRPMSLWISSLKQLEPAKHLISPLLWDFMEAAWPSPISLVVPRGEWVDFLGMKDSAKYVGTPQSVAIRIPDCSVTTHLIDLVGPIVVTSANPTGEADTTHHNQVYAKLGNKVDAVLCDGPSPENIASTVVDCTKIDSGNIGFFRVGIIPKSQVLQILEQVQKKHTSVPKSGACTTKGREEHLNHSQAVPNGVSTVASAPSPSPEGGRRNHTRL
uniref:Threonylcarbamoyl-AMP synthase n=1 Tax=Calidris pygmaea TaxID=425635 RepID=A0A8C3KNS9_9CHAR